MSEELTPEEYEEQLDAAHDEIKAAITKYLQISRQASLICTKFAVVAETYQIEEEVNAEARTLVHFTDNLTPWELYGMFNMVSQDVWMDSREANFMIGDDE